VLGSKVGSNFFWLLHELTNPAANNAISDSAMKIVGPKPGVSKLHPAWIPPNNRDWVTANL
jgi:hypothetical protein